MRHIENPHLSAEPLEKRWFLSSAASVEVVDIENEVADQAEQEVSPARLPSAVVQAVARRFPGARIIEADYSLEEGNPEYGIAAERDGEIFEATLTPSGRIIETERILATDDLPAAVLEWIRSNYPGAEIDEAVAVSADGALSYEVLIATREQGEIEATLRVNDSASLPTNPPPPSDVQVETIELADSANDIPPSAIESAEMGAMPVAQPIDASAFAQTSVATTPASLPAGVKLFSDVPTIQAAEIVAAIQTLLSGDDASALPRAMGMLAGALPVDPGGIERAFDQVLDQIESLGGDALEQIVATPAGASRLALLGALLAATLLVRDARKPRGGPVQVFSAANSSWSWILGQTTRDGQHRHDQNEP